MTVQTELRTDAAAQQRQLATSRLDAVDFESIPDSIIYIREQWYHLKRRGMRRRGMHAKQAVLDKNKYFSSF